MENVALLSWMFEINFGLFFENDYGNALAQGFEAKINNLIESE